eukprot:8530-Chlamydomonas_euryale.AAC.1
MPSTSLQAAGPLAPACPLSHTKPPSTPHTLLPISSMRLSLTVLTRADFGSAPTMTCGAVERG